MRIVVDMQCLQTGSRFRGIGRYSLALLRAMLQNPRGHEFYVVLNGAGGDWVESVRGAFRELLPAENVITWQQPPSASPRHAEDAWRREAAALLRESFIASLDPDVVHVASVFEGVADESIVTIDRYFPTAPVVVTHYDLIPHFYPDQYLPNDWMRRAYEDRLQALQNATHFLAISDYVAEELKSTLNVEGSRVTDIAAGVGEEFRPIELADGDHASFLRRLGLEPGFVLYAGGGDTRKNVAGLVRAYARLPGSLRDTHKLVLVSKMSETEASALRELISELGVASSVHLFGYVSDDDLLRLYNLCAVFVLPSYHEGFGLPLLEAMSCGVPAIGSNRTSIPEVLGRDHAMFDPDDIDETASLIAKVLANPDFAQQLRDEGLRQAKRFSWEKSAELALQAMEAVHEASSRKRIGTAIRSVAVIGSWKELPSWLPELATVVDVTLVSDRRVPLGRTDINQIHRHKFEASAMDFSHRLYCLNDTRRDQWCAELAIRYPGHVLIGDMEAPAGAEQGGDSYQRLLAQVYETIGYRGVERELEQGECRAPSWLDWRLLMQAALRVGVITDVQHARAQEIYGDSILPRLSTVSIGQDGARSVKRFLEQPGPLHLMGVAERLAELRQLPSTTEEDIATVAACAAENLPLLPRQHHLFVDVSELVAHGGKSGIQRVVREIGKRLLRRDLPGWRVEPVYRGENGKYRLARAFSLEILGLQEHLQLADEPFEPSRGDVFLRLDLTLRGGDIELQRLRDRGVRVYELVYDLLPVMLPEHFVPAMPEAFHRWLDETSRYADGVICISRDVADRFCDWLDGWQPQRERPMKVGYFHLGSDFANTTATRYVARSALLPSDHAGLTFLMVGTVEPRKRHAQVVDAFERLWSFGVDVRLVIVGKPGWLAEKTAQRLREHPESGGRLFWFDHVDDDELVELYRQSNAVIMASEAEGFGLPLVEAAHYDKALIVRDLPVFREVAGEGAFYFSGNKGEDLASALQTWIAQYRDEKHPRPDNVERLDWAASVEQLLAVVFDNKWYREWLPGQRRCAVPMRNLVEVLRGKQEGMVVTAANQGLAVASRPFRVDPGAYQLRIHLDVEDGHDAGLRFDCVARDGCDVLEIGYLAQAQRDEAGALLKVIHFENAYADMQVRVWADAGAAVAFRQLEFVPFPAKGARPGESIESAVGLRANGHAR